MRRKRGRRKEYVSLQANETKRAAKLSW